MQYLNGHRESKKTVATFLSFLILFQSCNTTIYQENMRNSTDDSNRVEEGEFKISMQMEGNTNAGGFVSKITSASRGSIFFEDSTSEARRDKKKCISFGCVTTILSIIIALSLLSLAIVGASLSASNREVSNLTKSNSELSSQIDALQAANIDLITENGNLKNAILNNWPPDQSAKFFNDLNSLLHNANVTINLGPNA